jgi:hypothetical protein
MAKADGVIAKEEIDAVTQFMNAIRLSSKDKETAINAEECCGVNIVIDIE